MSKETIHKAGLVVAGMCIGSGMTYLIMKDRMEKKYFAHAEEEIKSVKETYNLIKGNPPYDDPRTALKEYNERLDYLEYSAQEPIDGEVVEESDPEDDTEELMVVAPSAGSHAVKPDITKEERTRDIPYVIDESEFFTTQDDYSKLTITYYEEDTTLLDDADQMIPDIDKTVGKKNMDRFGEGTEDKNTVYVRNERIETDFEICRVEDSYSRVVLGIDDWDDHIEDPKPKIRKMRDDE